LEKIPFEPIGLQPFCLLSGSPRGATAARPEQLSYDQAGHLRCSSGGCLILAQGMPMILPSESKERLTGRGRAIELTVPAN